MTEGMATASDLSRSKSQIYASPYQLLVVVIIGIFLAEVTEAFMVNIINPDSAWVGVILDGLIMIVLIFPIVYYFAFRPLFIQIAERKRSEALLKNVLEHLPVGVWITDQNGVILNGNPAGQQIWAGARYVGIPQYGEYKGWWLETRKPIEPDDWAAARAINRGETSLNEEIEIECFDGTRKIILNSAIPIYGEKRGLQGAIIVNQDITDRKNFELQLERQNQNLLDLSEAEHRQRQLAEGLVEASIALNSSLELEKVLERILVSVRRAIPFVTADIILIEGMNFYVAQHWGFEGIQNASDILDKTYTLDGFPILQRVCQTHQPVIIPNVSQEPVWDTMRGLEWAHSYLAAPMVIGEQVIGIINLISDQVDGYNQKMGDRLVAFAAPAAVAVQNARLYSAELYAREVAEILRAASLELTQTLDLEIVMNTLLDFLGRLVPYDSANIVLLEGASGLKIRAVRGEDPITPQIAAKDGQFEMEEFPLYKTVVSKTKSLLIPDAWTDPDCQDHLTGWKDRSWLAIPLVESNRAIGALAMTKTSPNFFSNEHLKLAESVVAQASVAIQNAWLYEQVRAGHERLQMLSRRLVEIQEMERRYIARELHDESSQALTSLMFGLRLLEQEADHPKEILLKVSELKHVTNAVLENLHRLAINLRPASLDHLGLLSALEQLVQDNITRHNMCIHFKPAGFSHEKRLPEDMETALYRIVQEALNNAIRHSHANNIDIILELQTGEKVSIIVEDDGIGFDTALIEKSGHLGLLGMQERAQMMGGIMQIESRPGTGTTIVVEVPYVDSHLDRR